MLQIFNKISDIFFEISFFVERWGHENLFSRMFNKGGARLRDDDDVNQVPDSNFMQLSVNNKREAVIKSEISVD